MIPSLMFAFMAYTLQRQRSAVVTKKYSFHTRNGKVGGIEECPPHPCWLIIPIGLESLKRWFCYQGARIDNTSAD
jgi:hypothetical protein